MHYTAEDRREARELKNQGFNYIIRNRYGDLWVTTRRPVKEDNNWVIRNENEADSYYTYVNSLGFKGVTKEDSEPTSLDSIIANEKPKYERLTNAKSWADIDLKEEYGYKHIWGRLKELEDKIESGELIFREVEE